MNHNGNVSISKKFYDNEYNTDFFMEIPCPFCKKTYSSPQAVRGHFAVCPKYMRWRSRHTALDLKILLRTGSRKKFFYPAKIK